MQRTTRIALLTLFSFTLAFPAFSQSGGSAASGVLLTNQAEKHIPLSKNSAVQEKQKIFYLLSRVEKSPYAFMRNGEEHTGKEAARHLRWKYGKAMDRIKTAHEFIEYIAARSLLSGQLYMLKLNDGSFYPVKDVLYNELEQI